MLFRSISPFGCVNIYILRCSYVGCINILNVISFGWINPFIIPLFVYYYFCLLVFVLKSILSDISINTPAFFWFPFAMNIFFHPFTFSLCISLQLKCVSCRQHVDRSCFFNLLSHPMSFDWII